MFFVHCQVFAQAQITVGAEQRIDFTSADGKGVYFELLKKIYPDKHINFKIQSLNQSIEDFQQQKLDIIVGVDKYELTNALFPQWYLDTEYPVLAFYQKQYTTINYQSDLINLKPSWPDWYKFTKFIPSKKNPLVVTSLQAGFQALAQQKADVFIEYAHNLPANVGDKIASVEILPSQHIYVAFQHNQFGRKLAQRFDQQMESLRKKGELSKLFGREYQHSELANYITNKKKMVIYTNSVSLLNNVPTQNKADEGQSLRFIFNLLNGYQITFKSFKNIDQMYQHKNQINACFTDLIKTPKRDKLFVASKALSLFLGFKLYSEQPLTIKEPIDLALLLKSDHQYRLGTVSGRSYGRYLDDLLNTVSDDQLLQSPVDIKTLFKQFNKKRFNLLIEYPPLKAINWEQQKKSLYSYQIKGAEKFILGHVMCAKSPLGVKFNKDFNLILEKFYHTSYFFNAQYQRVLPENKTKFIQYFNEIFYPH